MEDEIRDKKDREIGEVPDFEDGALDPSKEDIENAELLLAWKEIDDLKAKLAKAEKFLPVIPTEANIEASKIADAIDWKARYEKIKAEYIKTRLEVSGSFGNWDYATRKRVLENEISKEVGFEV